MKTGTNRILITGVTGLIGGVLHKELSSNYDVVGVDRRGSSEGFIRHDLAEQPLDLSGFDIVIDLAGVAALTTPWPVVHENNIRATVNVLESAARAGVKRVIYASSNHVTGMHEFDDPYKEILSGSRDPALEGFERIGSDWPIRPDGYYALGKVLGEAAGRHFSEKVGMDVICLRIGTVLRADRPKDTRHLSTLLTHRDLVHLVTSCLNAPKELGFHIFYGVSNNSWRIWDIEAAVSCIGYTPQDDAEEWLGTVTPYIGPEQ